MRKYLAALAFGLAVVAGTAHAQSIPSAFTYQGELSNGSSVASGAHDLRFRLFDAAGGGNQIGATLCADNVTVVNGRFSVLLDFGASAFTNRPLFLEIEVRTDAGLDCSNSAGFTVLGPRQPLTPTPYARISADSVLFNGQPPSFYFNASNFASGTLSDARLSSNVPRFNTSGTFSGNLSFTGSTQFASASFQSATGTFSGSGAGLTALNATNISTGTLADARLSSNIAKLSSSLNSFSGDMRVLGEITAQSLLYSTPQVRHAFISPGELNGALAASFSDPPKATNNSLVSTLSSGASLHLPDGAVVTELRVYMIDNATADMQFLLLRRPLDGSAGGTMASIDTAGVTSNSAVRLMTDVSIAGGAIDNLNNQYFLRVQIEPTSIGTLEFRGAVVTYTVSNPLP